MILSKWMCNYIQMFDLFTGAGIVVEYRETLVTRSRWCWAGLEYSRLRQVSNTPEGSKGNHNSRLASENWQMGRIQKWPWLPTCFLSIESLKNHVPSEVAGYLTSWRLPRCFLCWLILSFVLCLKCLIHWYDVLCLKSLASKISLQGDRPINVSGASAYSLRRNSGTLSS